MILSETVKSMFKDAANKLTGDRRRDFMAAKVTEDYLNGSARKVARFLGWNP
ncbi:hypothetical protein [Microcoleus asticus]|uniref:hypothetical protein n=1 Tax=Microcoleus asticus TaxID=2815231 RepID=UPI001552C75D|nr:hypothetical protein [Microcoleus asticus]